MNHCVPFRLKQGSLVLALVSAAFAGQAGAAAGRVEFALGGATVVGANGQTRAVAKGAELDTGDTVRTNEGRVQVRMTDGAFISLQPNTEFGIKDYKFSGRADGTENALYSLLKGAMRTVTGAIGRVNRNRYQVATPTATVGIRGTGGLIQVLNDGSTLVQGTSGIWFLANPSGSIDIPAGVAGVAPTDPKQPPKETVAVPTAGPAPLPPTEEFVQGDERETDGGNVIVPPTPVLPTPLLTTGSGYLGVVAYSWFSTQQSSITPVATATFDGAGRMTGLTDSLGQVFNSDGSSIVDFGNDGVIAWGRWTGNVTGLGAIDGLLTINETYSADQGLHYVVGFPTAVMPTSGSATYTLLGATKPTFLDGSGSAGTFSFAAGGGMSVSFFAGGATLSLINAKVDMPSHGIYTMNGGTTICGSTSAFSFVPSTTGTGSACLCSCNSFVQGFFAGTTAERAGIAYHIQDSGAGFKEVIGTAALTK